MTMSIAPYLLLDGNAKEVIEFYSDVFDTKAESMELYKDWPQEMGTTIPEGYEDKIMHASLTIGSSTLMFADTYPGQTYTPGTVITLMLAVETVSDAEVLFEKLSSGGEVMIPLGETSFSPGYAQVKDKFGMEWQIVTDSPEMNE